MKVEERIALNSSRRDVFTAAFNASFEDGKYIEYSKIKVRQISIKERIKSKSVFDSWLEDTRKLRGDFDKAIKKVTKESCA